MEEVLNRKSRGGRWRPHVVAIPFPAQGHVNPLMRLCKTLASRHGFLVTFVNIHPIHQRMLQCMQNSSTQQCDWHGKPPCHVPAHDTLVEQHAVRADQQADAGVQHSLPDVPQSSPPDIRRISIPIDGLELENDFRLSFADLFIAIRSLSDRIESLVQGIMGEDSGLPTVTCLLSDNFMSGAVKSVAAKLGIPWVSFFPSSQSVNLLFFYKQIGLLPIEDAIRLSMDRSNPMEMYRDDLLGLPPLYNRDMLPYKHVVEESPRLIPLMVETCRIANENACAILVNTFEEVEGDALRVMSEHLPEGPPIYAIGPLTEVLEGESSTNLWKVEEQCIEWLNCQPERSVLYISFGSITLLSEEQFMEIVVGLQASEQRFLWVFRPDLVVKKHADGNESSSVLPKDFLEATKERSCFVEWAPQVQVLAHPAVGSFLTHCGWNSTIEGICAGVPMLCWPYLCDQIMDAKFIVEVWQVGMRFEGSFVGREEVERVVRAVMEGEEGQNLRERATALSRAAARTLQEGGSSLKHLQSFVDNVVKSLVR